MNNLKLYGVILLATISVVSCKYNIELEKFEVLPDATNKDVIDPKTFRLKQERRNTFVLTGNLEIYRNFGQSDTIKFEYHQRTITGNYIMLYTQTIPICEVTKMNFYPKILEVSNLPPVNTCPLPKGSYTINNLVIDETFLPPVLPKGECYILTKIFVDGKPVYGAKMSMNIKNA